MEFTVSNFLPQLISELPDSKLNMFLTSTGFELSSLDKLELVGELSICETVEQLKKCDERWFLITYGMHRERFRNETQSSALSRQDSLKITIEEGQEIKSMDNFDDEKKLIATWQNLLKNKTAEDNEASRLDEMEKHLSTKMDKLFATLQGSLQTKAIVPGTRLKGIN